MVAEDLRRVSALLGTLLPEVECHHIGATAIPGALTKGDLDVLLRVENSKFSSVIEILRKNFAVKQPQNWNPYFASFGSDTGYSLPLGVQLVVKDSEADFFLFISDYLLSHPEIVAELNRVKRACADQSAGKYWSAKDRILAPIVALKSKQGGA